MKESTGFPLLRVLKFSCADLLVDVLLRFLHSVLFLIEFYQKTMHCKKQEYSPTSALDLYLLILILYNKLRLIKSYQKTMNSKKQEYSTTSALGLFQFSPLFHLPHIPVLNENVYAVHLLSVSQCFLQHNDAILQL